MTYDQLERYLQNQQVYFRLDIVNRNFNTIAESGKVHNIGNVEIERLNQRTIAFTITVNGIETTMYEYLSDKAFSDWVTKNFIPVFKLLERYM